MGIVKHTINLGYATLVAGSIVAADQEEEGGYGHATRELSSKQVCRALLWYILV